ncbi:hypothetical protein M601_002225 [Cellulophaga baltica 4]|nr:hypothetical protein M601_002225 [Cellulophaga baltica 4]
MKFNYKYSGTSSIVNGTSSTGVSFAPDILREPTYFVGSLDKKLPFREAISALHEVVVADFNFQPKDNSEYLAWLKNEETNWIAEASAELPKIKYEIRQLQGQLKGLREQREEITRPYYKSQKEYFKYIYTRDYAAWLVLDPVITVHPDEVFLSALVKTNRSMENYHVVLMYSITSTSLNVELPTLTIRKKLYNEFQKIRTYKDTEFKIDPKGFDVQTSGEESYREVKIDLPDSWVRGFLQVSSAMTSDKVSFDLHPIDIANFIAVLKRNKEKKRA